MLDLSSFFISAAFAQETAAATPTETQAAMMNYLPFILIFLVFYLLVIRPQHKKLAEQDKMIKALQRGDRVVTSGGIHGKIAKIEDAMLMLEVADGVQIKIERDCVSGLETKQLPANDMGKEDGKK